MKKQNLTLPAVSTNYVAITVSPKLGFITSQRQEFQSTDSATSTANICFARLGQPCAQPSGFCTFHRYSHVSGDARGEFGRVLQKSRSTARLPLPVSGVNSIPKPRAHGTPCEGVRKVGYPHCHHLPANLLAAGGSRWDQNSPVTRCWAGAGRGCSQRGRLPQS